MRALVFIPFASKLINLVGRVDCGEGPQRFFHVWRGLAALELAMIVVRNRRSAKAFDGDEFGAVLDSLIPLSSSVFVTFSVACFLALSIYSLLILNSVSVCILSSALMFVFPAADFSLMVCRSVHPEPASTSTCNYLLLSMSGGEMSPMVSIDTASRSAHLLVSVALKGYRVAFSIMHGVNDIIDCVFGVAFIFCMASVYYFLKSERSSCRCG